MEYKPYEFEPKWRNFWQENQTYKTPNDFTKPKYYVLDMFPYPSGDGLHVGHPLGYVASDIIARYKRLTGYNVLHPMGFDAFGLPAEQYAIETGIHPNITTDVNSQKYKRQLDNLALSFDWARAVKTSDSNYYKWTQQIFIWLFECFYNNNTNKAESIQNLIAVFEKNGNLNINAACSKVDLFTAAEWANFNPKQKDDILMCYRLAYRKVGFVNWCEALGTVLANDEVKDGVSERGGFPVIKKPMLQWMLRITAYADRLLQGLEEVDFSEAIKTQQRNWIGRSEGARLFFKINNNSNIANTTAIEVFTTRPDTIFGATFLVLAPEHQLVNQISTDAQREHISTYQKQAAAKSERERSSDVKHISGVFTGAYAIHPLTNNLIPIWISDYVLAGYGTGAIMAVPSEDERDNRFALYFNLPIVEVLDKSEYPKAELGDKLGVYINSDFLNGQSAALGFDMALSYLEQKNLAVRKINFRFHDANFSRQRYWGEPFPIIYNQDNCAVIDNNLPIVLPPLTDFHPTADGHSPLARVDDWCKTDIGQRETDTMPGYAASSWYFLRYMDSNNQNEPFSAEAVQYWQQVDLYVGGSEHAVGHLLYSRFFNQFLYDLNKVPHQEPYKKLINQGMIQGIIETIYLKKEKSKGKTQFISADLVDTENLELYARIPVHIRYVSNYGSPDSFLDLKGIEGFKEWKSDYADAEFILNGFNHLVTHSETGKMSKSKYNVVNPDDVIREYGADCLRMYEMFLGPLEDAKPWNTKGIDGVHRFLRKFWDLYTQQELSNEEATPAELKILHTCLKKVSADLENFSFNTSVAAFMVATNHLREAKCHKKAILQPLLIAIAPFAPYVSEELWAVIGNITSIHNSATFPVYNENYLIEANFQCPVSINGKLRYTFQFPLNVAQELVEQTALAQPEIQKWTLEKTIVKTIFIKNKMLNIVVKD
jgi:leucyl-tRNA synthetase